MMNRSAILFAVVLALACVGVAIYAALSMEQASLSVNGVIALVVGCLATILLGAGLVGLMLYSNRHGYDERVGSGQLRNGPEQNGK